MTSRKKPKADEEPVHVAVPHAEHDVAPEPEAEHVTTPETTPHPRYLGIDRIVAFHLDTRRYALPIDQVQEIQQIVAFADMPDKDGVVLGMVNLRGQVIPAVDARMLLGMPPQEYSLETPMVICRIGDGLAALVVDDVDDVIALPEGCMQPAPKMHSLASRMFGVCRLEHGVVFVLDAERVMESADLPQHERHEEDGSQ